MFGMKSLSLKRGRLEKLVIKVPWKSLYSSNVVIQVTNLDVAVEGPRSPTDGPESSGPALFRRSTQRGLYTKDEAWARVPRPWSSPGT